MMLRLIVKLVVVLLFFTQSLAPFLHAHAGAAGVGSGAPLHLHLAPGQSLAVGQQPSFAPDDGRLVLIPPELRREGGLSLVDQPPAITTAILEPLQTARRHELNSIVAAIIHAPDRRIPRARAPPVPTA